MILEVIARARRRLLWNALAAQGARAVCISLGMLIVLLLLGTDILDWRYLLLVPGAILLAGACFAWSHIPGSYGAAQLLDRRLGLQDAISTALFFLPARPRRDFDEGMRHAQRTYAARIAAGISVPNVLPLKLSRLLHAGVVLALIACGLVGWRYRVHGGLDLRPPAAPAVVRLIDEMKAQLANLEQFLKQLQPDLPTAENAKLEASLAEKRDSNNSTEDSKGAAEAGSGDAEPSAEKQDSTMASENPAGNQGDTATKSQSADGGNAPEQGNSEGQQQGRQDGGSTGSEANSSGSDSSLVNKVRDTMANLLSAIKPGSGGRGGDRMEAQPNTRQQGGRSNGKQGSSGDQQNASGPPSQGEQGDGEPQAQQGGAPSMGQSKGAESDKQAGTGAGRDEGDKRIRLAEERAAMGKISVILGKRSRDVTGSTTMEVVSGEQELKTRYETRQAKHAAVQDRAERDQVPLELQDFVRQYLQAARAAASAGSSSKQTPSTGHASRASHAPKQK